MAEIEPASDELVAEIESGLEHVFPGPWFLEGNWDENGKKLGGWLSHFPPAGSPVFELGPVVGTRKEIVANARHLARMSPDNIAAILARLRAEQDRADKAEAELARLKAAIAEAEKHAPEAVHFIRAMARP